MIFLVNDANILIDLLKIDLLEQFFELDFDFQVTDMVVAEIEEDNAGKLQTCIDNELLTKQSFSFEDLMKIQSIEVENPALSIADCSCLYLAQNLNATLLTGDAALRRIALQQNIEVHGILWVLDEMLAIHLLTQVQAHDKLQQLMKINPRLPKGECKKRLNTWK
ncbi:hypothetical protein [Desulfosediminicola flagellatus]|uniref:hypothetical protein n=1 Tax=Desulfosediminicola flagellatus TaxID=2569541 RepID=UPI0010ACF3AC|nr:hypothetical protein [Desulfosediminicola flagellatus]